MAEPIRESLDDFITSDEAATILGRSPKTLCDWRWKGIGQAFINIGGKPMSVATITRLCERTGASVGACLAFILGLGRDLDTGKLVRIGTPDSAIDAMDPETEAALDWSEKHGEPSSEPRRTRG